MFAPVRLVRGGWPKNVERLLSRFVWQDPRIVLDERADAESFRKAMNAFHLGGTFKITGTVRHPLADAMLAEHVNTAGLRIVDIGASDGSTSVELMGRLGEFTEFTIADLYLAVDVVSSSGRTFFYDRQGGCVLIAGNRLLAWPLMSIWVRRIYAPLLKRAGLKKGSSTEILLLNPTARAALSSDPRVKCRVHDIFTTWKGVQPDVVKVANLLRRLYFDDRDLLRGLSAVHESLPQGGYLLLVDNPRIVGIDERAGLYRKDGHGFVVVDQTSDEPEIADLVVSVGDDAGLREGRG